MTEEEIEKQLEECADEILHFVAESEGSTKEHVRERMQKALDHAWATTYMLGLHDATDKKPSLAEFMLSLSNYVIKRNGYGAQTSADDED